MVSTVIIVRMSVRPEGSPIIPVPPPTSAIGVTEILYFAKATVNRQAVFTAYPVAAVFYLVMTFAITKLFDYLERRYSF